MHSKIPGFIISQYQTKENQKCNTQFKTNTILSLDHLFLPGQSKNPPDKFPECDPNLDLFSFDDFFNQQPTTDFFSNNYTFDDFLSEETPILQNTLDIDSNNVQISLSNSTPCLSIANHLSPAEQLYSPHLNLSSMPIKTYKPIAPAVTGKPIPVRSDISSKVVHKRMRNTESARRSRERKALRLGELEKLLEQSEIARISLASELAILQLQKKRDWSN
ncbi:hypothetical protein HDV01_006647 [Terramyces sp. JEL0728]|nr:hypothetical protein HDV01_006647 [Terramyces sp. JEL0728]